MSKPSTPRGKAPQTEVSAAIVVRFLPIGELEPLQATISRATAEELLAQLHEQLGEPEPAESAR